MKDDAPEVRQAKIAALVIALTMLIWLGAQWGLARIGISARYVFLVDLAAMGAFVWALIVIARVWWRRKDEDR